MNWLRTILDGMIVCIAFNGVMAFVWLLEPKGFSVMLPKGINTPRKELSKKELKPIRLMVKGTEDNELWKTGPWMKKFGIWDHWVKGPIACAVVALLCAGVGLLLP